MKNIIFVEAEIWTMARTDEGIAVLIKPLESERAVPIFISQLEAQSILIGMGNIAFPRPLTHDLFIGIFKEMNIEIERIEINDFSKSIFYACIIVKQGKRKYTFDARPSDAIGIAIRIKCPVYIAEHIVDEASIPASAIGDVDGTEKNKTTLEDLKNKLEQAIKAENYEAAAIIRDKIRELEEVEFKLDEKVLNIDESPFKFFEDIIENAENYSDEDKDNDDP